MVGNAAGHELWGRGWQSGARLATSPRCQRAGRPRGAGFPRPEESPGSTEQRCRVTPGGGDPRESATESRRRRFRPRHGERVRQERTARPVTEAARQTPPGARPNRDRIWGVPPCGPGWLLDAACKCGTRGMVAHRMETCVDRTRLTGPLTHVSADCRIRPGIGGNEKSGKKPGSVRHMGPAYNDATGTGRRRLRPMVNAGSCPRSSCACSIGAWACRNRCNGWYIHCRHASCGHGDRTFRVGRTNTRCARSPT